jgi:3-mercaptopyruvate sulfurtransferase SseA
MIISRTITPMDGVILSPLGGSGRVIKNKAELEAHFKEKGITTDKEVICYCRVGIRASQ